MATSYVLYVLGRQHMLSRPVRLLSNVLIRGMPIHCIHTVSKRVYGVLRPPAHAFINAILELHVRPRCCVQTPTPVQMTNV